MMMMMKEGRRNNPFSLLLLCAACSSAVTAFQTVLPQRITSTNKPILSWTETQLFSTSSSSTVSTDAIQVQASVKQLKRTLEREYASFFSPMERDFYAEKVTFDDPMTNLEGVAAYERNVDMLSGKNIIGKILFRDAGIVLHKVEGGVVTQEEQDNGRTAVHISDVITRWTLRLTFQALPWQPTARFSGISVYNLQPGGPKGVQVVKQTDYWDSINIAKGGTYQKVPKGAAIAHFLEQMKPTQFEAPSAGNELPYSLLRRGTDYEVRRYPAFTAVQTNYERRDEGFSELGTFSSGLNPLSPALFTVASSSSEQEQQQPKSMMWPLGFAPPGSSTPPELPDAVEKAEKEIWKKKNCKIVKIPERVVAIGSYTDASVAPVVRKADRFLREACERDGLTVTTSTQDTLNFAQYDAIYSMGKRRGEVWIELEKHPWTIE
eukprot:CAMPEP_0198139662 /NCGR_PEP_ID=MMETSP1443-20131203/2943_1 /TAXON_ID=186043 /ORGANISM="Entomoneis sp., Strain CCMP2396" /LENGTH=434 /DNA_ID=CAMNT_0043801861 /DNA_START=97 /DNA_END=1401 /DNA_ORIENTATION=+